MDNSPFSTKNYFQPPDGKEKSFFDEIPDPIPPKLTESSIDVQSNHDLNLVQKVSEVFGIPSYNNKVRTPTNQEPNESFPTELKTSVSKRLDDDLSSSGDEFSTKVDEPVICRIFSSPKNEPSKPQGASDRAVSRPSSFFDMLGSHIASDPGNGFLKFPSYSDQKQTKISGSSSPILSTDSSIGDNELFGDEQFYGLNMFTPKEVPVCERHRDAWIPSEKTRRALITAATTATGGTGGGFSPGREFLTMPGVTPEEEMPDVVGQLLTHTLGLDADVERKLLTANDVTQDERGLRQLIEGEYYRAAVNLTARQLTIYGQGVGKAGTSSKHTMHSIQLWFTRLALLVKLREMEIADTEANMWWDCDRPDLYYQFYPELYGGRLGTMIPFQMRLLLATIPSYCGRYKEALDRLFSVLGIIRQIKRNLESNRSEDGSQLALTSSDRIKSKKLWQSRENRVLICIVNIALEMKDYSLASEVVHGMIQNLPSDQSLMKRYLYSTLGRINLQLGDVFGAEKCFDHATESQTDSNDGNIHFQDTVDRALLAVAQNNFQEAFELFKKAKKMKPCDIMVVNNCAVCLLYLGRLKEAINELYYILELSPVEALQDCLVLNLCTLYELESSSHNDKKIELLKLVSKYKGDAINISSLKLT